ncbi:MAG: hypothetical protein JWM63_2538 [Gammaproteobacteria bacterium]|jgi:hypothetical protein|nr:hypothetical protein [Gammaproteobacteria bacterium]
MIWLSSSHTHRAMAVIRASRSVVCAVSRAQPAASLATGTRNHTVAKLGPFRQRRGHLQQMIQCRAWQARVHSGVEIRQRLHTATYCGPATEEFNNVLILDRSASASVTALNLAAPRWNESRSAVPSQTHSGKAYCVGPLHFVGRHPYVLVGQLIQFSTIKLHRRSLAHTLEPVI